jgi:hypothetical protein
MSMSEAMAPTGMTDRTVEGIRAALAGNARRFSPLLFAGPAVIASIAYMDPGNFATNIQAGSRIRLFPALGRVVGQYHRHAVPGPDR